MRGRQIWTTLGEDTYALDTGAGVVLRWAGYHSRNSMVFLSGHAVIDGVLVSKPMLEPSDQPQPGVTMGDRVEALQARLDELKGEHQRMLMSSALGQATAEREIMTLTAQLERERNERASGGLSLPEEKGGLLSLFRTKGSR